MVSDCINVDIFVFLKGDINKSNFYYKEITYNNNYGMYNMLRSKMGNND